MPCMCGDYCCASCGPAQGNWKCPICGEWASEACIHIGDDGSDTLPTEVKPEFKAEADAAFERERQAAEQMAKDYEEQIQNEKDMDLDAAYRGAGWRSNRSLRR